MNDFMTKVNEWELAWSSYINAIEDLDNSDVWAGEDYVIHVGRIGSNLRDAKQRLRTIDADFCNRLGI